MKKTAHERLLSGGFCLLAAAVILLLCSQSSPLYPINTWGDANCLLTVGRVMREGGVLYRDIYEQKGPTLYLIHALAACVSDTSFLGVYAAEVISLAAALYMAYRLLGKAAGRPLALGLAALWGALVASGAAFAQGDSAEEMCLPYLMAALCVAVSEYGEREEPMRLKRLFVCGLLAGVVATIKYTVLGLFVGLCLCEGILALRAGGLKRALRSACVFLAGMALPVLAWGAYFALNGALGDAYTAYIHNNIFLYSDEGATPAALLRAAFDAFRKNLLWAVPAVAGVLLCCVRAAQRRSLRLAVPAMAACSFAAVFFLGRAWPYCPLVLSVFAVLLPREGLALLPECRRRGACGCWGAVAACLLALAAAWGISPNAPLRGMRLEETAQSRLAEWIEPGATLLQYSHLDDGFYLVTGALPREKYFVRLNVDDPVMKQELDRYVREAIPDYVVLSWRELPSEFDRYRLIACDTGYDDQNRLNKTFYLYKRAEE